MSDLETRWLRRLANWDVAGDQEDWNRFYEIKNEKMPRDVAVMAIGYSVAGAFIATGIILFLLDERKKRREETVSFLPTVQGLGVTF